MDANSRERCVIDSEEIFNSKLGDKQMWAIFSQTAGVGNLWEYC